MTANKTHVFLVASGSRYGVLVEAFERPAEKVGVWVHEATFLYDSYSPDVLLHEHGTFHGWDPWLAAEQTGDRSLIDGSTGRRNKVRHENTLTIASARDRLALSCEPTITAPDAFLGVSLTDITQSVIRYGETIAKALPDCISACIVPSDETRTSIMTIYSDGDETQTEAEIPDHFDVHLVNDSPYLVPCITIEAGGYGTVDDEHWQRPTRSFRCALAPRGSLQIDTLDVGDLDFVNWYYLTIAPPHGGRRTFELVVRSNALTKTCYQQVGQLKTLAYRLALQPVNLPDK